MTRRADPERIFRAGHIAIRNSLAQTGMDEATAERWCDAWEIEAASRQLRRSGDYWRLGKEWIAAERAARRGPPISRS